MNKVLKSGSRAEMTKWRAKTKGQLLFQVERLEEIDANVLPPVKADKLEYLLHLIPDLNTIADMISRGEGYTNLTQAAGMYRGRSEKLYAKLSELAGTNPDWRLEDG